METKSKPRKKKGGFHTLSVGEKKGSPTKHKIQSKKSDNQLDKKKSISDIKLTDLEIINKTKYVAATLKR